MQAGLHALFQHLFHLVRIVVIHRRRPQGVADQVDRFLVGLDLGVFREDRAFAGGFDMFLQRHRVLLCDADQLEQQAEQIAVILLLPFRALEHLADILERMFGAGTIIADQKGAERGAADHDHFERQRLEDDGKLAARQQVAAKDHDEQDDDADNRVHWNSTSGLARSAQQ